MAPFSFAKLSFYFAYAENLQNVSFITTFLVSYGEQSSPENIYIRMIELKGVTLYEV